MNDDKCLRKNLLSHLTYSNKSAISEAFCIPCKSFYLTTKNKSGLGSRITVETLENIKTNYYSEHVTTTYLNKTKSGKVLRILKYSLRKTCQTSKIEHPEAKVSRGTFIKLRPTEIRLMRQAKWFQCLCDICDNIQLLCRAIKTSMLRSNPTQKIPAFLTDDLELAKEVVCDIHNPGCLHRKCLNCSPDAIKTHFQDWIRDSDHVPIRYFQWQRVAEMYNGKEIKEMRKFELNGERWELVNSLMSQLGNFPYHKYNAVSQLGSFRKCKQSLKNHQVCAIMDFAENYVCRGAFEAQNVFYSRNSVTIHPLVLIFSRNSAVQRDSVVLLTEDLKHDSAAVYVFVQQLAQHLRLKHPHITEILFWSDGCSSQYKSKIPFYNIATNFKTGFGVVWNFFGSRHGKGESDGESAVVKNFLDRSVKARQMDLHDAKGVYDFLQDSELLVTNSNSDSHRHFYIVTRTDIELFRENIPATIKIPGVRRIHHAMGNNGCLVYHRLSCYCNEICKHVTVEKSLKYPG